VDDAAGEAHRALTRLADPANFNPGPGWKFHFHESYDGLRGAPRIAAARAATRDSGQSRDRMHELGKALVGLGLLIVLIGVLLLAVARIGLPLGRLPGDFAFRGKNVSVYFPLGTSILLSVALSVLLYLISRFRR
jgi:hypothetical protein